jgi:hypothetical protein
MGKGQNKDQQVMTRLTEADFEALQAIADVEEEGNVSKVIRKLVRAFLAERSQAKPAKRT